MHITPYTLPIALTFCKQNTKIKLDDQVQIKYNVLTVIKLLRRKMFQKSISHKKFD